MKDDLTLFLHLFRHIEKERLSKSQLVELLKIPGCLLDLKKKVDMHTDHIWELHSKKLKLEKEIGMLSDVLR